VLTVAGILLAGSCRIGGEATAPNSETADMSGSLRENTWFSIGPAHATYQDQVLSFSGSDGWYALYVVLQRVGGPGTYSVTAGNPDGSHADATGADKTYSTLWGGSGQVVVDSLSATGASGTFFFTVLNPLDHRDNIRVQNGVFHVTF
jgi:hypothetical protein